MYVTTRDGLGQAPRLFGSFAGTLGKQPLPPEVETFLKEVRERPQAHKLLLLSVILHPKPKFTNMKIKIAGYYSFLIDHSVNLNFSIEDLIVKLKQISNDFQMQDNKEGRDFKQQIEAELQLRNTMFEATGRLIRDELLRTNNKVSKKLEPFLLDALLVYDFTLDQYRVAVRFAEKTLPARLAERIIQSDAGEAHLIHLGRLLRRYAEELQKKDADFKRLVEQERKKTAPVKKKKP